jgi:hypothetical protein
MMPFKFDVSSQN